MWCLQVAEVVAQVLLQAQTDVLVEVAGDPSSPPQGVDSAVAQVSTRLLGMCRQQSMHALPTNNLPVATTVHLAVSLPLLVTLSMPCCSALCQVLAVSIAAGDVEAAVAQLQSAPNSAELLFVQSLHLASTCCSV